MLREMLSLKGRVALVTGAGRQLGKAMAMAFAEMGAGIMVADINPDIGERSAAEIRDKWGVATGFIRIDAANPDDHVKAVAEAERLLGRLDIMVNNAGIAESAKGEDMDIERWRRMMAVDLDGVYYGCRAAFPAMRRVGGGSIINIASMSGSIVNCPQPQPHYNTAKAGVIHLTKSLAADWARYNIRVNSISPGYLEGPMSGPGSEDPVWGPVWMAFSVMKRLGRPEEMCGVALVMASDAGSFMTGADVRIDGGYSCL